MEFPSCYVYGGSKRKRKQGDSLRSDLESHVREYLNLTSLKTQDRKFMAWTLGDLAFFAYTSAIEQQEGSGVPATRAVHNTDFFEAASFIASERGTLDQTPESALRRVSANMATRFRESRLAEAVESFIALHGPEQRNVCPRKAQPAPAQPQRRDPPAAPRTHAAAASIPAEPARGPATGAGPSQAHPARAGHGVPAGQAPGGGWRPTVRSYGTQTWAPASAPATRAPPLLEPKRESEEPQDAGPMGPILTASAAPPSRPPAAAAAGAYGPQAGAATVAGHRDRQPRATGAAWRPMAAADVAQLGCGGGAEAGGDQGGGTGSSGRGGGGLPAASRGASRQPPDGAAADGDPGAEDFLPYTQRSGAASYDRQALRQQLLRPPLLGRSPHRDSGQLPLHGNPQLQQQHQRFPPPPPLHHQPQQQPPLRAPPPQHQQHQQQQAHHHLLEHQQQQHHPGSPHARSGFHAPNHYGPDADASLLQQQHCAACQTTPSSRDAAAAAAQAAARRGAWSGAPPDDDSAQQRDPPPQPQSQPQERPRQQVHPQSHAGRRAQQDRGQALATQQHPQQHPQQQHQQQPQQHPPPQQPQQHQPQQHQPPRGQPARPSVLSSRVPLARGAEADAQQQRPSGTSAAAGAGQGPGTSAGAARGPGRGVAGHGRAQLPGDADGGGGAGPSAPLAAVGAAPLAVVGAAPLAAVGATPGSGGGAAAEASGGVLAEPLWSQLRREYDKRLEAGALEARLRKHLLKKGNSMIKRYCHKEGLPWTLLEVACYGVALQKLASTPFDVESAVRFLARVKGWRPSDGAAAGAAGEPLRGAYEPPPAALLQKVAAVMGAAVAKYDLPAFIERQRRGKKAPAAPPVQAAAPPPQQPPATGPVAALPAGTSGPGVAANTGSGHAQRRSALPPHNANHTSPAETLSIGVTAPAAATTATTHQPQHSAGSSGGSGGSVRSGSASGDGGGAAAAVVDSADAAAVAAATGGGAAATKRARVKVSATAARKRSRGSTGAAGGGAAGTAAMEMRLRAYLARQGVSKLRRRNASEGVGWTLLDLAEADRDVRLQQGCDGLDAAEVVGRLLQSKLPPGKQLAPLAIQAVSASVCEAYDKFKLGAFVASEVNKRLKRRRGRGQGQGQGQGQAAGSDAAAGAGGGGGREVIDVTDDD